jgi:hypothetical protein
MKWSEFFSSAITGARDAGIVIEADEPQTAEPQQPSAEQAALAAEAADLRARIAAMEADARTAKHTALAANWIGATADHLTILSALDGSPSFDAYVRVQSATAEQTKAAALFSEAGSPRSDGAGSAWEKIQTKAAALVAAEGITKAQAIERIAASDKELYAQYRAEQ